MNKKQLLTLGASDLAFLPDLVALVALAGAAAALGGIIYNNKILKSIMKC